MRKQRIGDNGFRSDGHAPALVSESGSVDWWCPPRADQPTVFDRLLHERAQAFSRGGLVNAAWRLHTLDDDQCRDQTDT